MFTKFKILVKNLFDSIIITIYTDGDTEYHRLHNTATNLGVQHLLSPPYTLEIVGSVERYHRHIVEIGLTLLHQPSLPVTFWLNAFQTATYLINRLPTPILKYQSPFEKLFSTCPNYTKLHTYGCLCYPWLKPYTKHKLEPKSRPCIFLGYSIPYNA